MALWGADARYTQLVRDHGSDLLRLAIMLSGNRHDAEDVVQDVLISVASAWPVAKPLPYLKRAVANRCIDIQRKRRDVLMDAPPETPYDDPGYLRHDDARRFFELVRALPDRQRETLVLRFHLDLDDAAIAKMQGVSINTVRTNAQNAPAKLRASELTREEQS